MTIRRLLILQVMVLAGLSTVFILPKSLHFQPAGVNMTLPEFVGEWYGRKTAVTERELEVLAADTEFSRMEYTNGRGDVVQVSVVLSGFEMSSSIHHPERCLPAQGWTLVDRRPLTVFLPGTPPRPLPVMRLHNVRPRLAANGEPAEPDRIYNLSYYWFVGCTDVSNSHFSRMMIDARDRLFLGYAQRWAYTTVTSTITKGLTPFGRDEAETDTLLKGMIQRLAPLINKESVRYR
jgi:EpsI family protein